MRVSAPTQAATRSPPARHDPTDNLVQEQACPAEESQPAARPTEGIDAKDRMSGPGRRGPVGGRPAPPGSRTPTIQPYLWGAVGSLSMLRAVQRRLGVHLHIWVADPTMRQTEAKISQPSDCAEACAAQTLWSMDLV